MPERKLLVSALYLLQRSCYCT